MRNYIYQWAYAGLEFSSDPIRKNSILEPGLVAVVVGPGPHPGGCHVAIPLPPPPVMTLVRSLYIKTVCSLNRS